MKYLLSLALLLFTSLAIAGEKIAVASRPVGAPVYGESELEIGDYCVFDFTNTSDGSKPFGGKPYRVEIESRDNSDPATAWRGKVEVPGKAELVDQAFVFAGNETPEWLTVRVIVDNQTVYRHAIHVNRRKLPPLPSPYTDQLKKAYAADKGTPDKALAHASAYKAVNAGLAGYAKGSDLWTAIDSEYKKIPSLPSTRLAISQILFDTTRQYYDASLTSTDRRAIGKVLSDIQSSLEACAAEPGPNPGPGPAPVPVGPAKLWMVVIEETSQAASNRGSYFANAALANKIKASGHKYRVADKDIKNADGQTPPDLAPYISAASGKTLPWVFLVDQTNGKVYHQGALPATPAALVELLTKVGG